MPPAGGLASVLFVDQGSTSSNPDGSLNNPYPSIQAAVDRVPMPVAGAGPWEDWTILIAPGEYDASVNVSGPVRLALIGLGAFRLGRYKVDASNLVPVGPARNIVWTYHESQRVDGGPTPQLVIGMVGGTDVVRRGKPIANLISGSIILQGGGWDTASRLPPGGSAYLAISHTQVDGLNTMARPIVPPTIVTGTEVGFIDNPVVTLVEPTDRVPVSIDTTGVIEGFEPFTGILVDRHFNSRFRGAILGSLNLALGKPPGYVVATSFMSQYEGRVQVTRFTSAELCGFEGGMTVAHAPNLDLLKSVVPPGMLNSTFAGTFTGPPGSLLLDAATNTWFIRNGARIEGGATKAFLDGASQTIRTVWDKTLDVSDCGVTLLADASTRAVMVQLPAANNRDDLTFTIKNIAVPDPRQAYQIVMVRTAPGETIDGFGTFLLSPATWSPPSSSPRWPSAITIVANAGNWWIVSSV